MKPIKNVIQNGRNLVIGPVRLVYAHILEPWASEGTDPSAAKYQTGLLIPEDDARAVGAIDAAIDAAVAYGIQKVWGGVKPKKLDRPLRSEDDKENAGPEYKGMRWMNAKSKRRPSVVDKAYNPITDAEAVYSGCWALLNLDFFPYENSGKKGVSVALNSVMKVRDDEALGGGVMDAQTAFSGVSVDDDDDDFED